MAPGGGGAGVKNCKVLFVGPAGCGRSGLVNLLAESSIENAEQGATVLDEVGGVRILEYEALVGNHALVELWDVSGSTRYFHFEYLLHFST